MSSGDSGVVIVPLGPESVSRLGVSAKLAPSNPLPLQELPVLGSVCRVSRSICGVDSARVSGGASGPFERASRCSVHPRGCGLARCLQGIEL